MANFTQVPTNTFVKGLVTEAGELTFPEGASIDELNCDLLKDGSRRRRLAIEFESGSTLTTETLSANTIVTTSLWEYVGEQSGVNFVVVQIGGQVLFFELGDGSALSANRVDTTLTSGTEYTLDLTTYNRPSGNGAGSAKIQTASIKGGLVIASSEIDTILVTRDITTGAFSVSTISFEVRDFEYQGDTSTYMDEKVSPSIGRQYDTANCGWTGTKGAAALSTYKSANSNAYPPLTHPWYSGKDSNGDFKEPTWQKVYTGNTLIVNGHYILDLYSKDRDTASGLTGVTTTVEDARFSTVENFAGRVFYSGMSSSTGDNGNKVYFSQLLEHGFGQVGKLLPINDPTSEEIADVLDTDGGFVAIPGATNILRLHTFGPHLYVFAENGVWRIGGVDDVFRASEFTVVKVTDDGLTYANSFISAQGRPYWWSTTGIFTLQISQQTASIEAINISAQSIQSFWNDITPSARDSVSGIYDTKERRIMWLYPNDGETNAVKKNKILLFDELLTAFFPWTIVDSTSNTDYIVDAVFNTGVGSSTTTYNVVDSSGDQVIDSSGNTVVVNRAGRSLFSSRVKFLVVDGATGKFTFAEFTSPTFLDWGDADYTSYAEAGYNFLGDLETRKAIPFITTFMKTTETGWVLVGSGYELVRESSCDLTIKWDFKKNASARAQDIYRRKVIPTVDTSDLTTVDLPTTVVISRIKPRGSGRVMRLVFTSKTGKDFHILGWNTLVEGVGKF